MPNNGDMEIPGRASPAHGKLIDLHRHRSAEAAVDELLLLDPRDPSFSSAVRHALTFGPPFVAAAVRRLDAARPKRLEALGKVLAAYPDRREAADVLARAATDRRNSDSRRMAAAVVLEHWLGITAPDDFLATLREPVHLALSLLTGALEDVSVDTALVSEYTRVLLSQPPDALFSMLESLAGEKDPRAIAVFRMLALQNDSEFRQHAVEALGAISSPEALQALLCLSPNLPPDAARLASRAIQKLRLSGVREEDRDTWQKGRALVSAIDGSGERLAWFIAPRNDSESSDYIVLALLLSDLTGVVAARTRLGVGPADMPDAAGIGAIHTSLPALLQPVAGEDEGAGDDLDLPCLEVPFNHALELVRFAVEKNWRSGTPLPPDYQVYYESLWQNYRAAELEQSPDFGVSSPTAKPLMDNDSDLLFDPVFDSWFHISDGVDAVAEEVLALDGGISAELTDRSWNVLLPALIRLAHDEFDANLRARYANRLRQMSAWLEFAGKHRESVWAASAARTMVQSPPEANLFVLRLVQKGILVSLDRLTFRGSLSR